jgi:hypothetical protein
LREAPQYFLFGFLNLNASRFPLYIIGLIWLFAGGALVTHWSGKRIAPGQ